MSMSHEEPNEVMETGALADTSRRRARGRHAADVPVESSKHSAGSSAGAGVVADARGAKTDFSDKPKDKKKKRSRLTAFLPLLLVLAGVGVLLYPVLATQHNNKEQQRIADQYTATVNNLGPDVLAEELASAEKYNANLEASPILDPWLESQRPDTPAYQAYLHELDLNQVMARVVIPKIHVDLPIYHGTSDDILAVGVGHLFGTSLPVGGTSTHSVLTGHTGLGTATLFDNLTQMRKGDFFYVNTAGRAMKYKVVDIQTVLPNETESLNKVTGRDLITLITCTPYGVNSHRLLVTGERVAIDPVKAAAEEAKALPAPMQTWMLAILCAVALIMTVLLVILVHWLLVGRKRKKEREERRVKRTAQAPETTDSEGETK